MNLLSLFFDLNIELFFVILMTVGAFLLQIFVYPMLSLSKSLGEMFSRIVWGFVGVIWIFYFISTFFGYVFDLMKQNQLLSVIIIGVLVVVGSFIITDKKFKKKVSF